ncbi:ATP-binding protein [Streptomyces sp. CHD11]|uniref:ATP-binding protein n=1 Tax=Streptomyces sp. CHD11 TaxID=2741325 RepID=UPI001BFC539D|nr:ATP-binding protein [Streptomyces sp. CHD11]MBT3154783.1 ATP-binding protein [Streptomyces sp. CHD11]
MTSPLLPGDRPTPRSMVPVPLLTAALAAAAVLTAFLLVPEAAATATLVTGTVAAVLLCAAAGVAAYFILAARAARTRLESVTQDVGRLLQERARLSEESRRQHERLTGELNRERARLSAELDQERARLAETLAAERDRLTEQYGDDLARLTREHDGELTRLTGAHTAELERLTGEHAAKLHLITEEHTAHTARTARDHAEELKRLEDERTELMSEGDRLREQNARLTTRLREANGIRAAAVSATANAAGRMQALSTGMLADLRAMEEKHHDEEVLADLLHLDHRTAQAGRLADSVAVLTGARSGRRWARPIAMESILRGAMGRISGYQRIRVHSASDTAVAGHAAEGVMHALAELLDNAANFSPPTAEVHVYVEEVPAGVIVSVEDSGLVMGEAQLRRAERAVSGESTELGGLTGTRLGLAVVGRLARRYGLRVSYRPSARGGTGVLILVPQDILVPADAGPSAPLPVTTATPAGTTPSPAPPRTPSPAPSRTIPPAGATAAGFPAGPAGSSADPADIVLPQRRNGSRPDGPAALPASAATPGRPEPETSHTTAHSGDPTTGTDATPAEGPTPLGSARPAPSYAASRAGADLDPDPVPTHESPTPETDETEAIVLPRRRRGRTLAEAERGRSGTSGPSAPRPAPTAEETRARTARFSSFRQAVRTPTPDDTADPDTPAAADTPGTGPAGTRTTPDPIPEARTTPATPEGDTTS